MRHSDDQVKNELVANLKQHLNLALALSEAVYEEDIGLSELLNDVPSEDFRHANLLRHHFVRAPLLNFTTYSGPLSKRLLKEPEKHDPHKLKWTPRFLNFDECMLLAYSGNVQLDKASPFDFANMVFEAANRHSLTGVTWVEAGGESDVDEHEERV